MPKPIKDVLPYIAYGGDYNPEQWEEETWYRDAELMQKAGVNLVSVAIFSWAVLEVEEDVFQFEWLDKILDILHEHGVGVCLATATASPPAWMTKKYDDIPAVDEKGIPYSFGSRQHYSPSSPSYRKGIKKIVKALAERYKEHPALKMWHINNEYGCHLSECYSSYSLEAFHHWLQEKYKTIEALNKSWGTNFWSQRYNDWAEIDFPVNQATFYNPGQKLDYKRFMNDQIFDLYLIEKNILRDITPEVPVFTNFMYQFKPLDYFQWAKELDVVTWDSYPDPREGIPYRHAFHHDLMRSLRQGQPFLIMEQVTSHVNWRDINLTKPPGTMRLWSYGGVARGADGVMFFQWRQGRAGAEKFHGAMIPHSDNEKSRTFQETAKLGNELKLLDSVRDARVKAKAAILMDWENWWAVELEGKPHNGLSYMETLEAYYKPFFDLNIAVDIVHPAADLSEYSFVVAPMLYALTSAEAEKLENYTAEGGTILFSFFSGIADKHEHIHLGGYPGPLRKLSGIYIDEFVPQSEEGRLTFVKKGRQFSSSIWADVIYPEGAETVAAYETGWLAGIPAVTKNRFGKGTAYYIGTAPEERFLKEFIKEISEENHVIPALKVEDGVEVSEREGEEEKYLFVINHNEYEVNVKLAEGTTYYNMLSKQNISGKEALPAKEVLILSYSK
ncbi:beta-galactosidase [Alkalicoccus daliensis]|nr:beta-galactosidase [Alkalicoccus daliensis]